MNSVVLFHALKSVQVAPIAKWLPDKKKLCRENAKEARTDEGPRPDKFRWPRCDGSKCCKKMLVGDNLTVCFPSNSFFKTSDRTRIAVHSVGVLHSLWKEDRTQTREPGDNLFSTFVVNTTK